LGRFHQVKISHRVAPSTGIVFRTREIVALRRVVRSSVAGADQVFRPAIGEDAQRSTTVSQSRVWPALARRDPAQVAGYRRHLHKSAPPTRDPTVRSTGGRGVRSESVTGSSERSIRALPRHPPPQRVSTRGQPQRTPRPIEELIEV
jgi:hypothetical protein